MLMDKRHHYGPIYGLTISSCGKTILSSHGTSIHILDMATQKKVYQFEFPDTIESAITHIVELPSKDDRPIYLIGASKSFTVVAWNGHHMDMSILENSPDAIQSSKGPYIRLKDRIMCAHLLKKENRLVFGFGRNLIQLFNVTHWHLESPYLIMGPRNCIIYSMAMTGDSIESLQIASGTVFNEILIWKINMKSDHFMLDPQAAERTTQLKSRLTSEMNGIIMCHPNELEITHELKGHDGVIFSCAFSSKGPFLLSTSDDRTVRLWNLKTSQSEFVGYGHRARVWQATFYGEDMVVSCSEDTNIKLWNVKRKKCVKTLIGHLGKNMWVVDTYKDTIVAGGQNGALYLYSSKNEPQKIDSTVKYPQVTAVETRPPKALENPTKKKKKKKKKPKQDRIIHSVILPDKVMIFSQYGKVHQIMKDGSLRSLSDIKVVAPLKFSAYFSEKDLLVLVFGDKSIRVYHVASDNFLKISGNLVETAIDGEWKGNTLYTVTTTQNIRTYTLQRQDDQLVLKEGISYVIPDKKSITAFEVIESQNILIIGNIKAKIWCIDQKTGHISDPLLVDQRTMLFSIKYQASTKRLYLSCLHGIYTYRFEKNALIFTNIIRTANVLPRPEYLFENPLTKDMMCFGYFATNLIRYNISKRQVELSVEGSTMGTVYSPTRILLEGKTTIAQLDCPHEQVPFKCINQVINHGREILDIVHLAPQFYMTSSEDTSIHTFRYDDQFALHHCETLERHDQAIKCLTQCPIGDDYTAVFMGGGKEQLSCYLIDTNTGLSHEEIFHRSSLSYRDAFYSHKVQEVLDFDNVTFRISSLSCMSLSKSRILLASGSSDSMVKVFIVDYVEKSISLAYGIRVHAQTLVTKVHLFHQGDSIFVASSSTNGTFAVTKLPNDVLNSHYQPAKIHEYAYKEESYNLATSFVTRLHGSGIQDFAVLQEEDALFVVTCGDDQDIQCCRIPMESILSLKENANCMVTTLQNAHASSINGVAFMDNLIFSVSIDQRVCVWEISGKHDIHCVFKMGTRIDIADPQALHVKKIEKGYIIQVVGCGIQTIQFSKESN